MADEHAIFPREALGAPRAGGLGRNARRDSARDPEELGIGTAGEERSPGLRGHEPASGRARDDARDVLRLVMGKGLRLVGIGTLFGLALGFAVERFMNSMLFSTVGTDVTVYIVGVPAMLLVTMLAAWIPARRAARIPPTLALRCE